MQGYTGALVANGRAADAVKQIQDTFVRMQSSEDAESSPQASPIELNLLLAKVYSQWRGHTTDAFATYDEIIKTYPSDFRCAEDKPLFLNTVPVLIMVAVNASVSPDLLNDRVCFDRCHNT